MRTGYFAALLGLTTCLAPGCRTPAPRHALTRDVSPKSIEDFVVRHRLYGQPYRKDLYDTGAYETLMVLQVGTATPPVEHLRHRLWLCCYQGEVEITIGQVRYLLRRGDQILVPRNIWYYIKNIRPGRNAILMACYTPRFDSKTELPVELPHDHERNIQYQGRPPKPKTGKPRLAPPAD